MFETLKKSIIIKLRNHQVFGPWGPSFS